MLPGHHRPILHDPVLTGPGALDIKKLWHSQRFAFPAVVHSGVPGLPPGLREGLPCGGSGCGSRALRTKDTAVVVPPVLTLDEAVLGVTQSLSLHGTFLARFLLLGRVEDDANFRPTVQGPTSFWSSHPLAPCRFLPCVGDVGRQQRRGVGIVQPGSACRLRVRPRLSTSRPRLLR